MTDRFPKGSDVEWWYRDTLSREPRSFAEWVSWRIVTAVGAGLVVLEGVPENPRAVASVPGMPRFEDDPADHPDRNEEYGRGLKAFSIRHRGLRTVRRVGQALGQRRISRAE